MTHSAMLDFSCDFNQPCFYSNPCTRCLKCESPVSNSSWLRPFADDPEEEGDQFYEGMFWRCENCEGYVAVGLGAKNQVTGEILWKEIYKNSDTWGTDITFKYVALEKAYFEAWPSDFEGEGYKIETLEEPCVDDSAFTSSIAAIAWGVRLSIHLGMDGKQRPFNLTLDGSPISNHGIVEILA